MAYRVQNRLHLYLERRGRAALILHLAQQWQRVRQQVRRDRQLQIVPVQKPLHDVRRGVQLSLQ